MSRLRHGTNVVEFALTLPIFLALLGGVMDYGWLFMNKAMADSAVAKGCRDGSIVDPRHGDPKAVALASMDHWFSAVNGSSCQARGWCHADLSGTAPTRMLVCSVSFPIHPLLGLTASPTELHSYTITRMEWQN